MTRGAKVKLIIAAIVTAAAIVEAGFVAWDRHRRNHIRELLLAAGRNSLPESAANAVMELDTLRGRDISRLIDALGDDESNSVRYAAQRALTRLGGRAAEPLAAALQTNLVLELSMAQARTAPGTSLLGEDISVMLREYYGKRQDRARRIVEAGTGTLSSIGAEAVPPMVARLNSADSEIRYSAVRVLMGIRDRAATAVLFTLITDSDSYISAAALENLAGRAYECWEFGDIDDAVLRTLFALLDSYDAKARHNAATILCGVGNREVADMLAERMENGTGDTRLEAVFCLGVCGDARAIEPLLDVYRRGEYLPGSVNPAFILAKWSDSRVLNAFAAAVGSENPFVRRYAVEGLCRMVSLGNVPETDRPLAIEALKGYGGNDTPKVGDSVRVALYQLGAVTAEEFLDPGGPGDLTQLMRLATAAPPFSRGNALADLARLAPEHGPLERWDPNIQARLNALFDNPDPSVRRDAVTVMAFLNSDASSAFEGGLKSPDEKVRIEAAYALALRHDYAAINVLRDAAERRLCIFDTIDPADVLAMYPWGATADEVASHLAEADETERTEVIGALVKMATSGPVRSEDSKRVVNILQDAAGDPSPAVRKAAEEGLAALGVQIIPPGEPAPESPGESAP